MHQQVNGILLLDKPSGMTSNSALQQVKRLFKAKKAGHTGSLDPIATGMLPVCFGEATKFSQFLLESDKTYQVMAKLGVQTTTGDSEGAIIATKPTAHINRDQIETAILPFLGEIEQIPPMFSAIKYHGKPLYELARKGIEVSRSPRQIKIFSLKLEAFVGDQFTFQVHCSKGTYIRTLVEDIAFSLGCGAHVIELRRLTVKPYGNAAMYTMQHLAHLAEEAGMDALYSSLLPVESAVECYPAVKLSTASAFYLRMGQPVRASFPIHSSFVRLFSDDARFLGVGEVMTDGRVKPHRLLSDA